MLYTSGFVDVHVMLPVGQNQCDDFMFGRARQVAAPVGSHAMCTGGKVCCVRLRC